MPAMTLTADGLIPLPKEIKDSLGLRPGDRIDLRLRADGVVELAPEQKRSRLERFLAAAGSVSGTADEGSVSVEHDRYLRAFDFDVFPVLSQP